MTARPRRGSISALTALTTGLVLLGGCTAGAGTPGPDGGIGLGAGTMQLVAFESCADALRQLRTATKRMVGPWGLGGGGEMAVGGDARADAAVPPVAGAQKGAEPAPGVGYSGTNTHEVGVDEPDLVKTDGRRIVTVSQSGVLTVIDPVTRVVTGRLSLREPDEHPYGFGGAQLLLSGDHALVLIQGMRFWDGPAVDRGPGLIAPQSAGPTLMLVDLAGAPRLLSTHRSSGTVVDARQVGSVVRVVTRSAPQLEFPQQLPADRTDAQRTAANRAVVDRAGIEAWQPRYRVTTGDRTTEGRVGCNRLSRPASYSGTSLLSVYTFDLNADALNSGDPVSVLADGDTVYSNGQSLYVASDARWQIGPVIDAAQFAPSSATTTVYKFDISGAGRPRYVAAGSVKGWLVNQYALSEWDGHLRLATTLDQTAQRDSSSTVYVLRQSGRELRTVGRVGGLGQGERIYAVRFIGPTGYVVTFRQTDPLYTVDLSTPTKPRVTGELKITGYSAYLHPISDGRLLGVGQEASTEGRQQGTQVSLFDVGDLNRPTRLARHHVRYGQSEAEFDPHAFLWWAQRGLLAIPLNVWGGDGIRRAAPTGGLLVLRVGADSITEVGMVEHRRSSEYPGQIRRSLVIGDTLWTVSDSGVQANDMSTLDVLGWIAVA